MTDTISFKDAEEEPISLRDEGYQVPPSDDIAKQRAAKFHIGLGEKSPGMDVLYQNIQSGSEQTLRESAAVDEAITWQSQKNTIIADAARKVGARMTPEAFGILQTMTKQDFQSDPNTVFEKKFAEKYVTGRIAQAQAKPGNVYSQVSDKVLEENADIFIRRGAENQVWQTFYENQKAKYDSGSWLTYGQDFVMEVVPFYAAVSYANQTPGSPASLASLTGKNIREQIQYIRGLPIEQGLPLAKQVVEALASRSDIEAMHFTEALLKYSTSDEMWDSSTNFADMTILPLGRMVRGAVGGAKRVLGIADEAPRVLTLPPWTEIRQSRFGDPHPMFTPKQPVAPRVTVKPDKDSIMFETTGKEGNLLAVDRGDAIQTSMAVVSKGSRRQGFATELYEEAIRYATAQGKPLRSSATLSKDSAAVWENLRELGYQVEQHPGAVKRNGTWYPESSSSWIFEIKSGATRTPEKPSGPFTDIPNLGLKGGREAADERALGPIVNPSSAADKGKTALREEVNAMPRVGDDLPTNEQFIRAWDRRIEAQAVSDVRGALEDTVRAVEKPNPNVIDTIAASGDIEQAGFLAAFKRFGMSMSPDAEGVVSLERELSSFSNPWNFYGGGGAMANTHSMRLIDEASRRMENLMDAFGLAGRVSRLTPEALKVALEDAANRLKNRYLMKVNDGFLDMVHIPAMANPANVDTMVMRMGRPGDATPFASRAEAKLYAEDIYSLAPDEYRVYRQGSSFYVGIPTNTNELAPGVLSAMHTPKSETPRGMMMGLFDRLRTSEDLLSKEHSAQRKIAQHSQQSYRVALGQALEPITSLSRVPRREVEQVLELNRDGPAARPGQTRGNWYETAADFENAFYQRHKKLPSDNQTAAYYAYRQVSDIDYLKSNLTVYRDKAIAGMEQFALRGTEPSYFEGVQRNNIPWDLSKEHDFVVGIHHADTNTMTTGWAKRSTTDPQQVVNKAYVDDLLKKGYEIIQVGFPSTRPMKGHAPDLDVNFVVTNASTRKPLSWHQVDYNPGGHVIYPHQWYIKQPLMNIGREGRLYYHGDATMMNFATEAEAKKYVERVNTARQMLLAKDQGLGAYLAKNLPYTREAFEKMFQGRFSLDHEFRITQTGRDAFDTSEELARAYPNAVSYRNNPLDMNNFISRQFVTERDAIISSVKETGDVLQIVPARQLDPYNALQAGLNQRIKNVWMNDYKHMAVKNWVEEFKDVLNATEAELRAHPYQFVYNPQWKTVGGTDQQQKLAAAKASRMSIVNFLGTGSEVGDALTAFQNKILSGIYNRIGQGTSTHIADHYLPAIQDPASYFRAAAFHLRLGLFNPVQLTLQAQSVNHIAAVAGLPMAYRGASATPFMMALAHTNNPKIIAEAGRRISKVKGAGWTPDTWNEMYTAFRSSGLYEVMSEAALRNDLHDQHFFRSAAGYTVDKGAMFFNTGERIVRLTAFATAYREAKAANAALKIDDRALADIMQRADLLSVNMTRASLADFQKGVLATPIQFATYQFRLAEQFLGHRLTTAEKLHAFAWYSAVYGVPTAAGVGGVVGAASAGLTSLAKGQGPVDTAVATVGGAVGMWPTYEDIRAEARKRNIDMSPAYIQALAQGLPSLMMSVATGKEWNYPQRMGPGQGTMLKEILHGEDGIKTALGAAGSISADILKTMHPLYAKAVGMVTGGDAGPELTMTDLNRVLKNASSWDLATKTYGILQYGKHYNKRGEEVTDADPVDALAAVMGLQPLKVNDIYAGRNAMKEVERAQEKFKNAALEEYRLYLQYSEQGDHGKAEVHYKNAAAHIKLGDFNPTKQVEILRQALSTMRSIEDRTDRNMFRNAPERFRLDQLKAFTKDK